MTPMTLDDSARCKARPSLITPSRPNALCLDCSRRDAFLADSDPQIEPKWGLVAGVWTCLDRRSAGVVSEHAQSVCGTAQERDPYPMGGDVAASAADAGLEA